jgi:hypothetical protein
MADQYDSFESILKSNRKLYYTLHNRGILQDTMKDKTRRRNKFVKSVVDLSSLIQFFYKFDTHSDFRNNHMSAYVVLRRHGIDTEEAFENRWNKDYIRKLYSEFGQDQIQKFLCDNDE